MMWIVWSVASLSERGYSAFSFHFSFRPIFAPGGHFWTCYKRCALAGLQMFFLRFFFHYEFDCVLSGWIPLRVFHHF
ncbi:hypothetical protein IWZ00DRAFT_16408 [Phyllosticta capitalensis]